MDTIRIKMTTPFDIIRLDSRNENHLKKFHQFTDSIKNGRAISRLTFLHDVKKCLREETNRRRNSCKKNLMIPDCVSPAGIIWWIPQKKYTALFSLLIKENILPSIAPGNSGKPQRSPCYAII